MSSELLDWLNRVLTMEQATRLAVALIILAGAIIGDRLVREALTRYSKTIKLDTHLENSFKL